jgi:hypothetical protein
VVEVGRGLEATFESFVYSERHELFHGAQTNTECLAESIDLYILFIYAYSANRD